MLEDRLNQDLKTALLAADKQQVTVLRGLKSAILYAKIAENMQRDKVMSDAALISLLQREAKKRQESADLYRIGGNIARAEAELSEKSIIERYLPVQLDDTALRTIVDKVFQEMNNPSQAVMGQIIAKVRSETSGTADGARIAQMVRERFTE